MWPYRELKDLCVPQKLSEKSTERNKDLLLEHFKPKYLMITVSHWFYNCKQKEGKSVYNFFIRLKDSSSTYEVGTFLKRALRDKLVCRLNNENTQKRL